MDLPKLALFGVIVLTAIYVTIALIGIIVAGPVGIIFAICLGFTALLFLGVLQSRLRNKEDDYYEKNIKD